jgi:RHS repeat-associated protein
MAEFNQTYEPSSDPNPTLPHGLGTLNSYLNYRNSFYWDKQAYQQGAGDYTKAVIYHFCHDAANTSVESDIPESTKKPLENRVWNNYPGQSGSWVSIATGTSSRPSATGRVMDDGTTQMFYYQYNAYGNITNAIDPVGRNFTYVYASNNVDLLQTIMTHNGKHELLTNITYNSQHLPLMITDASGQTTTNTYNARGQILTTTDPKGETTSYSYDPNGYLLSITGPLQTPNDVLSYTYDGFGRVETATDTEGYTLTYNYDAADRKTQITHPDGTSEQFIYTNLDLFASIDRLGRWAINTYNANRQLVQTQDPLGRITRYEWCRCGAMTALIDPMGRTTTWDYDVQSRPIAKHYADGSTIKYNYESTTSRLKSRYDEKGQQTIYAYYPDNNIMRVSYPNAIIATPTVMYTYDPDYNRVLGMQDGMGTTTYTYNPITPTPALGTGRLASVGGPLPNSTVTYQYDQLGRVVSRAINSVAQAIAYDILGRPTIVTNALGTFHYAYVDATSRLSFESYPNAQTNLYSYYNNLGDERLLEIQHLYPNGSLLSGFGYGYNAVGQITAWTNLLDTLPASVWQPSYDAADQLTNVVCIGGNLAVTNYTYAYDPAGNRLLASTNGVQSTFSYNALNQLTASSSGTTNGASYEWDAENRLTAITQGANRSEFSYDGLGRRLRNVEKANGVVQSDNYYLWCETDICEIRDASGATVLRRLLPQGESLVIANGNSNYFYAKDLLGSVREALNSNGELVSRYSYDPYGQKAVIQENVQTTFGFTGDFVHSRSGLYLTKYRPFDCITGRWLSRDPSGESVGFNLYAYVGNNPLNRIDHLGLVDSNCQDLCRLACNWSTSSGCIAKCMMEHKCDSNENLCASSGGVWNPTSHTCEHPGPCENGQ